MNVFKSKSGDQRNTWKRAVLVVIVAAVMIGHYIFFPPDPAAERLRKGRPVSTSTNSETANKEASQADAHSSQAARKTESNATKKSSPVAGDADLTPRAETVADSGKSIVVPGMTIRDLEKRVVFRGDVDLTETVRRIRDGERLDFPNDGTVFQNREKRLPERQRGYYREFVHPTRGLKGPGPQRIVRGQSNEWYYTPDHYETFHKLSTD
ncbi:MAG: hypothetical protein RIS70_1116 [Planctomycetota bacterium]|jgi:filamentous hemagglutinin